MRIHNTALNRGKDYGPFFLGFSVTNRLAHQTVGATALGSNTETSTVNLNPASWQDLLVFTTARNLRPYGTIPNNSNVVWVLGRGSVPAGQAGGQKPGAGEGAGSQAAPGL